jgi:hypothetical protein
MRGSSYCHSEERSDFTLLSLRAIAKQSRSPTQRVGECVGEANLGSQTFGFANCVGEANLVEIATPSASQKARNDREETIAKSAFCGLASMDIGFLMAYLPSTSLWIHS